MSRLGRGKVFPILENKLHESQCRVYCTEEDFANQEDDMMKSLTIFNDEMFAFSVRKHTSAKMREMVRSGYCVGCLPFGLKPEALNDRVDSRKIIVHHEIDATNVKIAFDLFIQTQSLAAVRDFLKSVSNRQWTTTVVKSLLQNRIYLGELRFGDWENLEAFDPVVETSVFDEAQKLLGSRQKCRAPRTDEYNYLLRGLVRCPHCNCAYTNSVAKGGAVRYYECYHDKKKISHCPVGRINCDVLHRTVIGTLSHLVTHHTSMHEAIRKSRDWETPPDSLISQRAQLGKALQVLGTRQRNLLNAIEDGEQIQSVKQRLILAEAEERAVRAKISLLDTEISLATRLRPTAEQVQDSWAQVLDIWEAAEDNEKAALLRLLIESLEIHEKDRAILRLATIVELPSPKFGTSDKMGAGVGFEPTTLGSRG